MRCASRLALLCLALLCASAAVTPAAGAGAGTTIYLPSLSIDEPVRVETTYSANPCPLPTGCGYPDYYYVRGYVHNLGSAPLYGVTLEITYGGSAYCSGEEPCGEYTASQELPLPLAAVLPGQPVPFAYDITIGKASVTWARVALLRSSDRPADGRAARALTVVGQQREGSAIAGTVRNDSGVALADLRALAAHDGRCAPGVATLGATSLAPGQSTIYRVEGLCAEGAYHVIGVGLAP